jgi:hypothetical protein
VCKTVRSYRFVLVLMSFSASPTSVAMVRRKHPEAAESEPPDRKQSTAPVTIRVCVVLLNAQEAGMPQMTSQPTNGKLRGFPRRSLVEASNARTG